METSINEICRLLKEGKTILYPTDTIWGIGCDATNSAAVTKVFDIKKRPTVKSMIVLVSHDNMLERYVRKVPDVAWDIIDASDTPTTIVYPGAINLAPDLMAEDGSIAIRLVSEGFAHDLIQRFNRPLVSTSANLSGDPFPASYEEIAEDIINAVDLVAGENELPPTGRPSSIIKLELNGEVKILRQ